MCQKPSKFFEYVYCGFATWWDFKTNGKWCNHIMTPTDIFKRQVVNLYDI